MISDEIISNMFSENSNIYLRVDAFISSIPSIPILSPKSGLMIGIWLETITVESIACIYLKEKISTAIKIL